MNRCAESARSRLQPRMLVPGLFLGLFLALLQSAAIYAAVPAAGSSTGSSKGDSAALQALFDREWQRDLRENPTLASSLGDRRYNDQWPDVSLAAQASSHKADIAVLHHLKTIDDGDLDAAAKLNYELFRRNYEDRVEAYKYRNFLMPMNQRGGIQTADQLTERLRFTTVQDIRDWVGRLQNFGAYMDQTLELLRTGVAEGRVQPQIILQRIPAQVAAQIVDKPEESPFYAPLRTLPDSVDDALRKELRAAAAKAIRAQVVPAYQRLARYVEQHYLPTAREDVGAWALPDGDAFYRYRVRSYTTTDLTPEQIHATGLAEVARIRAQMEKIIEDLEFAGTFQDFLHFLRTDPQFYFDNPDDLMTEYLATSKRIDPELVRLFGKLPRMPYGLRAIPAASAPDTTTAYYSGPAADGSRAGYYYVNLYRPEVRPKYEIEVLTVHEAMPGHHLQIALAQELGDLPEFRRFSGFTAFVEGWGLYSESLGAELGLYQDPYSHFGQLTYEMWRAVRLVVDTGMHSMRWTRERAIKFFSDNAAKTEHDIVNEIDRYIAWPGQALAYKIGELRIKALRARAEEQLGEHFDIRGFHDVVLGSGAVPLDILEANVDAWIAQSAAE